MEHWRNLVSHQLLQWFSRNSILIFNLTSEGAHFVILLNSRVHNKSPPLNIYLQKDDDLQCKLYIFFCHVSQFAKLIISITIKMVDVKVKMCLEKRQALVFWWHCEYFFSTLKALPCWQTCEKQQLGYWYLRLCRAPYLPLGRRTWQIHGTSCGPQSSKLQGKEADKKDCLETFRQKEINRDSWRTEGGQSEWHG